MKKKMIATLLTGAMALSMVAGAATEIGRAQV